MMSDILGVLGLLKLYLAGVVFFVFFEFCFGTLVGIVCLFWGYSGC